MLSGISVSLKIQQILRSHELEGHTYPKIIEATFSFPKFVASSKKSIYSNYSFLRYIQFSIFKSCNQIDDTHFLPFPPKKLLVKNFFILIVLNMQKIRLFHSFVLEISFFCKYCNLITREHFGWCPSNKVSIKYRWCTETQQII